MKPIKYPYSTKLTWTEEHKGKLRCEGKPDLQVACPPEWGGHPNIWSPEDLFIGSVEICTMTTFLWLAEQKNLEFSSYHSEAEGIAQIVDGEFGFPLIEVTVHVTVASEDDAVKVRNIMEEVGKWCLVSKSLKPPVTITTDIIVENE